MRLLLAALFVVSTAANARPYAVGDLTSLESYGQILVAGKSRLLIVERRGGYDSSSDFGFDYFTRRTVSRVLATSLDRPGRLTPLFAQSWTAGYWPAGLSPNGRRLAVFRLRGRELSLGVVELASREVRWFAVTPDLPIVSPSPIWLDDYRILVVATPPGRLPEILSLGSASSEDTYRLWRRAADGFGATSTIASTGAPTEPEAATRTLRLLDTRDGSERELLHGNIIDVAASPDRSHLAVVVASSPRTPPPDALDPAFVSRRHELRVVDLRTAIVHSIADDILPGLLEWSPDGTGLLAFAPNTSFRCGLFVMSDGRAKATPLQMQAATVLSTDQSSAVARGTWFDGSVVARSGPADASRWRLLPGGGRPLPVAAGAELVGRSPGRLWFAAGADLVSVDRRMRARTVSSRLIQVGPDNLDPSSSGVRGLMNPDGRLHGWLEGEAGRRVARDASGKALGAIPPSAQLVALGSGALAVLDVSADGVGRLWLASAGRHVEVDEINTRLAGIDPPLIKLLHVAGRHHWLFLPNGHGRAPLVTIPYPGQTLGTDPPMEVNPSIEAVATNLHILNAAGFAVLMPSLPPVGPKGRPDAFLTVLEEATEAAIATDRIDPNRMAMLGHSFGAFAVMSAATRPSRYRAFVASSGPYDLAAAHASMAGADRVRLARGLPFSSSAGWAEGGQAKIESPPVRNPERYVEASPIFRADRVNSAVMLIHGDGDIVALEQAEHMFMELARAGKDATLVRYWGEGHVLASPANIKDYWSRVITFIRAKLGRPRSTPSPTPRS